MSQLTVDIVARTQDVLKKLAGVESAVERLAAETKAAGTSTNFYADALADLNQTGVQTTAQMRAQLSGLVQLRNAFKDDVAVVAQLDRQIESLNANMARLNPALGGVASATTKAGNAARGSSQKFFQVGQAISDFSVAGIRGAANNLEFLALQLGLGGPLLLGIAAATSALVVFGDDILRALNPVGEKVKELRAGLEDVFRVIETGGVDLILFEDQIPRALEEAEAAVKSLQAQLQAIGGLRTAGPGITVGGVGREGEVRQLQKDLADALAILEEVQAKRDEFTKRDQAAASARTLSAIEENELLAETIRGELERIGLVEEVGRLKDDRLVQLVREGKLEEFVLKAQEKRAKANKEEVSELQKAKEKLNEVTAELDRRRAGELSALDAIRDQTAELNRQIAVVKKLNEARKQQEERDAFAGGRPQSVQAAAAAAVGDISPLELMQDLLGTKRIVKKDGQWEIEVFVKPRAVEGIPDDFITQQAGIREQLEEEFSKSFTDLLKPNVTVNGVDGFSQERLDAIYAVADGVNLTKEAFDAAGISASDFYFRTTEGLERLSGAAEQAAGNFASAFATAYDATDGKQRAFFVAYKAFAIAEATIATYNAATQALKAGPIVGPILAAGIVAAGLANVARIASTQPGGGGGGGGGSFGSRGAAGNGFLAGGENDSDRNTPIGSGYERLPNGAVVPVGSFQPPPPVQAFQPLAPSGAQVVQVEGVFDLQGENLRAAVRNTDKRVSNTRGVAA